MERAHSNGVVREVEWCIQEWNGVRSGKKGAFFPAREKIALFALGAHKNQGTYRHCPFSSLFFLALRYFCRRLLGLSGIVRSIKPALRAGWR